MSEEYDENEVERTGVVDHGAAAYTPAEEVVDQVARNARVQNPEDVVGMCSECGNVQNDDRMYKSIFAQTGAPAVCTFCGGVVVILHRELAKHTKDSLDTQRGAL